ncbi:MAG: tRNA preQ1(34) S-adenosylmethionine ribosyltransferase-isomerase QueA [Bacillota bacterium]|nr:tRNA preQ1(34) S-adenosylmethionine ribosyltransferase-isomerase QueA [Bacillota bacterium]HHU61081.1 tRNA preQ1(34) S-adenosylmethionine ribosyltransferase-isomerase QueA [Natronincola sp.]
MKVADFDFRLPDELIAQTPLEKRDESRLLVVNRTKENICHGSFPDLIGYLTPKDVLVINDTRVLPARLFGQNVKTLGLVEILLLRPFDEGQWEVLVKPGKRARVGAKIMFSPQLACEVLEITSSGGRLVNFQFSGDFEEILSTLGETPLPPYIHKKIEDPERYQTVYSNRSGSVAAPTAGLHFTPEILGKVQDLGVAVVPLTLHVGLGTFRPVQSERVEDHVMHEEYYTLEERSAQIINERKREGGRVFAVGTTSVRVLESVSDDQGQVHSGSGWTNIFIYPGYSFKVIDALLTNFHLPRSSLLMLVSAFAGTSTVKNAYEHAIDQGYRFFSFGDAMLIV